MLPAVIRPEPPITGDESTLLEGADGAPPAWLRLSGLVPHMTLVEEDWCPRVLAGSSSISVEQDSDADLDDRKVSVGFADVELYVRHGPMSLMMEEGARPGGRCAQNDGSVGE